MNAPVVVIFLTRNDGAHPERTEYAVRTIQSVRQRMHYDNLYWYVADGGSVPEHREAIFAALDGVSSAGYHFDLANYGADANKAWNAAHEQVDLTFWLEDDWELVREFELKPYANLLLNNADIGMVRLGYLNLGMKGSTLGFEGHMYWKLQRDADSYVFTGHPSLRHRRFREAYGPYPEGLKPGETELGYAWQYRSGTGPEIVYPADIGIYGPFGHIGQVQSY